MHRFFQAGFEPLHAHVVDLLAQDGVHSLLPLLGVNREWRTLAVKRMLKEYQGTLERMKKRSKLARVPKPDEGEYVLVFVGNMCAEGPEERDDPRSNIADVRKGEMDDEVLALFLSSFDPATMLCTFKPSDEFDGIEYDIYCNEERDEWPDVFARFYLRPTGWFRPANKQSKASLRGLELAARPDRHPPCLEYLLHPDAPAKPPKHFLDGDEDNVEDAQSQITNMGVHAGPWRGNGTASYTVERLAWLTSPSQQGGDRWTIPAVLTIHEYKIPFIDLFVPVESTAKPGYVDPWAF